jgi:hypothetical protein
VLIALERGLDVHTAVAANQCSGVDRQEVLVAQPCAQQWRITVCIGVDRQEVLSASR